MNRLGCLRGTVERERERKTQREAADHREGQGEGDDRKRSERRDGRELLSSKML